MKKCEITHECRPTWQAYLFCGATAFISSIYFFKLFTEGIPQKVPIFILGTLFIIAILSLCLFALWHSFGEITFEGSKGHINIHIIRPFYSKSYIHINEELKHLIIENGISNENSPSNNFLYIVTKSKWIPLLKFQDNQEIFSFAKRISRRFELKLINNGQFKKK